MNRFLRYLRYDWPLHFALFITNWFPDNVIFLRLRGRMAAPFVGACMGNLRLARNILFHNPANIRLGKDVFMAYGCLVMATDIIEIADEVMMGPYCVVVSGNHLRASGSFRYGSDYLAPIHIGKGVWLGSHVIVTAGAKIGTGCLIAAGAVVSGEIPCDSMAGGMPARVIKELSDS